MRHTVTTLADPETGEPAPINALIGGLMRQVLAQMPPQIIVSRFAPLDRAIVIQQEAPLPSPSDALPLEDGRRVLIVHPEFALHGLGMPRERIADLPPRWSLEPGPPLGCEHDFVLTWPPVDLTPTMRAALAAVPARVLTVVPRQPEKPHDRA